MERFFFGFRVGRLVRSKRRTASKGIPDQA
jgi:hypothetical protein